MKKKKLEKEFTTTPSKAEKIRKQCENIAVFGMILVALALLAPFMNMTDTAMLKIYKWVYAAGALIFAIARLAAVKDPKDSPTLRRLRRLEFWAGMAFVIGGCFWFYNEARFADNLYIGPLAILRETVLFSLAGAVIQVIASWMIYGRQKKEEQQRHPGAQE